MKYLAGLLIVAVSLLSGCASIVGTNSYPVTLSSTPSDARFVVATPNGRTIHTGTTPATVMLASSKGYFKSANYLISFSKPGFEDTVVELHSEVNGWYFGNFLVAGVVGLLVIDPITGAMWRLPDEQDAVLPATVTPPAHEHASLHLITPDQLSQSDQARLVRVH